MSGVLVTYIDDNGVFCRAFISADYDTVYLLRYSVNDLVSVIRIDAYSDNRKAVMIRRYSQLPFTDLGNTVWFEMKGRTFHHFSFGSPNNHHLLNKMSDELDLALDTLEKYPKTPTEQSDV
ncbi:MAG: hypothetical protein VKL39_04075 [Leptolyngbyaceae bacterium]|nr:hypothetical protein [Leptolyngbyaceae bacterium]